MKRPKYRSLDLELGGPIITRFVQKNILEGLFLRT